MTSFVERSLACGLFLASLGCTHAAAGALEEPTQSPLDLDRWLPVDPSSVVVFPQAKTNGTS
jgi:hypothetical protein